MEKVENDFKVFLEKLLNERKANNSAYSLRAFARQLNIESSLLSKILLGKRRLTHNMISRLCLKLEIDPLQTQRFQQNAVLKLSATAEVSSQPIQLKRSHAQVLKRAIRALGESPMNHLVCASDTLIANADQLSRAQKKIDGFRAEIAEILQPERAEQGEVYRLAISLFPDRR